MLYNQYNRRYDRGSTRPPSPAFADGYEREKIIIDPNDVAAGPGVTELWGFEPPSPPVWRVANFVREGYFSIIAAHAGSGKSFLALFLALCAALGIPFFGRETKRSRVLYLDYEMDGEEQKRRLSRMLSGLGITVADDRLRGHLYYHRAKNPLSTAAGVAEVQELVEFYAIDFIVVDSLTFSLGAADASAAKDVVPVLLWLQGLGISGLILDHFSKGAAQGNHAFATPFGSTMKFAVARSVFNLTSADGGGHLLQATKSNFGPSPDALCYEMGFEGELGPIVFKEVERTDAAMAGASQHLRAHDVTLVAIEAIHAETGVPVTQQEVVDWRAEQGAGLELALGSVQNHFTTLKKRGNIVPHEAGGYLPADAQLADDKSEVEPPTDEVQTGDQLASEETQSEETQSEETQSEETQSEETQSEETQSEETQSEETQSEETQSEETQSEETQSTGAPDEPETFTIDELFSDDSSSATDTANLQVDLPPSKAPGGDYGTDNENVAPTAGRIENVTEPPETDQQVTNTRDAELAETAAYDVGATDAGAAVPSATTPTRTDPLTPKNDTESGASPEEPFRRAA